MTRERLILADDHCMVLEALARHLGQHFEIVGTASNVAGLLRVVQAKEASCLLLDFVMPEANGLELVPTLRRLDRDLRIVVVTMLLDRVLAEALISAGADGFVPKSAPISELCVAINEVLAGRRYVSPLVPKSNHRVGLGAEHLGLYRLTPRQQQIVLLLGDGLSPTQIAHALHLSPSAITFHKHNIMRVLGIETDGGLIRYAVLVRAGIEARDGGPPPGPRPTAPRT